MPEISVIVPIYKVEPYIHRCVDSILAQTFTDFELILVDDGSPDSCGAICDEYASRDERIKVIHKNNGGLSSARNAGLRIAEGRFVLFCDSDDYVDPLWCEVLFHTINNDPEAFIVCDVNRVETEEPFFQNQSDVSTCHSTYFQLYKKAVSAYACNKIFDRGKIEQAGLSFDETVRFAEDVPFTSAYCKLCQYCIFIPAKLYYYYNNTESIMNRFYPNAFELHLPLFYSRLPLISKKDLPEYCDIWFYHFCRLLDNVFDDRNVNMSFLQKMRYNQRMIHTKEFIYCLKHASLRNENPRLVQSLRDGNYYIYWLIIKLSKFKHLLMR